MSCGQLMPAANLYRVAVDNLVKFKLGMPVLNPHTKHKENVLNAC